MIIKKLNFYNVCQLTRHCTNLWYK